MNSWHSIKEPARYCSMLRPSTTYASMQVIMLIPMRRETASAGVSTPSCGNVLTLSGQIASVSWSTWPLPGGLYCSSPGREEEKGTNGSTLRSDPEVQDCFPQSEQGISAAGRQMDDQATSAAAASTHSFSSSRSKEQSASAAAAAVPPGQWEQVLHLWQCGPLCQELSKKSAEADASTKSRQGKKAEGTRQAREAQLHYSGGVT